jgi:hypothetical protein
LYVKKKLAVALKAAEEGHVISHNEVKKRNITQLDLLKELLKR